MFSVAGSDTHLRFRRALGSRKAEDLELMESGRPLTTYAIYAMCIWCGCEKETVHYLRYGL